MPNKIKVNGRWHVMDEAYVAGARYARYAEGSVGKAESWTEGFRNERYRRHILADVDVLSLPDVGQEFDADDARTQFCGNDDAYALALMRGTGALDAARVFDLCHPAALKEALAAVGIDHSRTFCETIFTRIRFEDHCKGEVLSPAEVAIVETLSDPVERFMLALGRATTKWWRHAPDTKTVAREAGRSTSWVTSTAARMKRERCDFLAGISGNGFVYLRAKGWTGYRLLEAKAVEANASPDDEAYEPSPGL